MPCYKPLLGIWDGFLINPDTGKKRIRIIKNGDYRLNYREQTYSLFPDFKTVKKPENTELILIPCGKCIGCRLEYSRNWADRMMLELETTGKGMFVTLTYDDDHLGDNQLDKRDSQLFMKRLRDKFSNIRIRFYCAGEYGSKSGRRHMHIILFGIGLDDIKDKKPYKKTRLNHELFTSETFNDLWQNQGYVILANVSWETCAYVARYVTKKLNSRDEYRNIDRVPEFSLMSRKPGIGREYLDLHPDCLDLVKIPISTAESGVEINIPKYYLKQMEIPFIVDKKTGEVIDNPIYNPEKLAKLKETRKRLANDKTLLELNATDLDFQEYLDCKMHKKERKTESLIRSEI